MLHHSISLNTSFVQLSTIHNTVTRVLQAGLVVDWVKSKRLLVLVRCVKDQALFILTSQAYPVTNQQDLAIDTAIPIDGGFR